PRARSAMADAEAAEAPQLDLLSILERVNDAVEHRIDDDLGVLLGELSGAGDLFDQLGLGHPVLQGLRHLLPFSLRGAGGRSARGTPAAPGSPKTYSSSPSASLASRFLPRLSSSAFPSPACSSAISSSDGCSTPRIERPTFFSSSSTRRMRVRTQSPTLKWSSSLAPAGTSISLTDRK